MTRRNLLSDGYDVLRSLAEDGRAVLSPWRAHLYLRRSVDPFYPREKATRVVQKLEGEGLVEPVEGAPKNSLFRATGPYAPAGVNVHEAASEAYYAGALCFGTALEVHRLSEQRSRTIHVFTPRSPAGETARRPARRPGSPARFRLLRTHGQAHHWVLDRGGHTLAVSGNAYARQEDDLRAIAAFRDFAPGAPAYEGDGALDPHEQEVTPGALFEVFRARDGEYHWRFLTALGEVVAEGAEGYVSAEAAFEAVDVARDAAERAETEEEVEVAGLLPLGTTAEDWRLEPLPTFVRLGGVGEYAVQTHSVKPSWLFGTEERAVRDAPVRVTDVERTLLDGLRYPKHCGGLGEVFRGWVRAAGRDSGGGGARRGPARRVRRAVRPAHPLPAGRLRHGDARPPPPPARGVEGREGRPRGVPRSRPRPAVCAGVQRGLGALDQLPRRGPRRARRFNLLTRGGARRRT